MRQKDYPEHVRRLGERLAPKPVKPCGGCTLCCKVIPVKEIGLKAYTRCPHERGFPHAQPGCAIYHDRPSSCRVWTCEWALSGHADDLRPDRCGVVVDPQPDMMRVVDNTTGEVRTVAAVQMWAALGYEDAFKRQPVLAMVLAALEDHGYVLWRMRGDDGAQVAMGIFKHNGELSHTAPAGIHAGFTASMSEGERLLRAGQMMKGRRAI
jgi:hypothetical protein